MGNKKIARKGSKTKAERTVAIARDFKTEINELAKKMRKAGVLYNGERLVVSPRNIMGVVYYGENTIDGITKIRDFFNDLINRGREQGTLTPFMAKRLRFIRDNANKKNDWWNTRENGDVRWFIRDGLSAYVSRNYGIYAQFGFSSFDDQAALSICIGEVVKL